MRHGTRVMQHAAIRHGQEIYCGRQVARWSQPQRDLTRPSAFALGGKDTVWLSTCVAMQLS